MRLTDELFRNMPMRRTAAATLATITLVMSACSPVQTKNSNSQNVGDVTLALMETSDIHANLLPFDYYKDVAAEGYGLAKVATLVKAVRAESPLNVLVDNGDLIQGSPLGEVVLKDIKPGNRHVIHEAMVAMRYDVASTGNHDFNFGLDFLRATAAASGIPQILANVTLVDGDQDPTNDQPLFKPWIMIVRNVGGVPLKIGVIGFVPPQIMNWDKLNLTGKVVAQDIVTTARRYVPDMRKAGADIIVAVAHSGITVANVGPMTENASLQLAAIDGIDAVLMGHSHQVFPGSKIYDGQIDAGVDNVNGKLAGKPAVMPGFWGSHLGVIYLDLARASGTWKIKESRSKVLATSATTTDSEIAAIVKPWHDRVLAHMRSEVGKTVQPITTYLARIEDSAALELVNAAQAAYVKERLSGTPFSELPVLSATAPLKTGFGGGTDYTAIPAGPIALKHAADLYMYPNLLVAVQINGAQLKGWLERAAENFNRIDPTLLTTQELLNPKFSGYNFDVIDGIQYAIDVTKPVGQRIVALSYAGNAVKDSDTFAVATNNYRAGGGGNFSMLQNAPVILNSNEENREVVIRYIRQRGTLDLNPDHNWTLVNRNMLGKDVQFTTALALAPQLPAWLEAVAEHADKLLLTVRLKETRAE